MGVAQNLAVIRRQIPDHVTLVAVSKTKPDEMILEAYEAGQRDFGENKVQDMLSKKERLPSDIRWHMIGHLQSNKVRYLAPFVTLIHGVDSVKLLKVVEKEAAKADRTLDCLLQLHIAEEETKFGFNDDEIMDGIRTGAFTGLEKVRIRGVMGMATYTENSEQIRREFRHLNRIFEELKAAVFADSASFNERSFGMSGDFQLAIEEGSTMVRIGSLIFGPRNY